MNDDRLRDRLHAAVPEPPPAPDRARGARERARRTRRRTTVAAVAGAVLVVATLASVPALTADDGDPPAPVAPTPSPTTAPGQIACPGARARAAVDSVPPGAVAVRLCQGAGVRFDRPTDALVTGVDELVDVVNAQPTMPPPDVCSADGGIGYVLAFEYGDGTVVPVSGERYGCHELRVGATSRANADRPWRRFIQLLRAQRAEAVPPAARMARPVCDDRWSVMSPVARPDEMVSATLCVSFATQTEHGPVGVPVPDADLAVLLHDWVPGAPEYDPSAPTLKLIGTTRWGDRVDLFMDGFADRVPGADARRDLDRLVARAARPRPTIDASSSAADVVAAYADLLNLGDRASAADLWHPMIDPELPTAYSHVDAQVEGVRPLRFISAWRDATSVTTRYREVPPDGRFTEYRQAMFTLGRDEQGVLRIVALQVGEVVPTGR